MFPSKLIALSATVANRLPLFPRNLEDLETEEISPADESYQPPIFIQPGDLDKVTATEPQTSWQKEKERLAGGMRHNMPTRRHRVRNALSTPHGVMTLTGKWQGFGRLPWKEFLSLDLPRHKTGLYGAYPVTRRYFGHFISDALPAGELLRPGETLLLPHDPGWIHAGEYVGLMGYSPLVPAYGHFDSIWICDDRGLNQGHVARVRAMHDRLQAQLKPSSHQGVFMRRGRSGSARILLNEDEVAEALQGRGFGVVSSTDPLQVILAAMAGVQTVVSMEGSQWVHGHFGAAKGALLVTINPADRFNNPAAEIVPVLSQRMATIVAPREGEGYRVDVARLLALIDRSHDAMIGEGNLSQL